MSNLLQVSRMKTNAMTRKGTFPLYMEVNVNPELAPYLVSSTSSVLWVEEPDKHGLVKTAVRTATPGELFRNVFDAVVERGRQDKWGNVHPFTAEGMKEAIIHVDSYSLGNLEILMAPFKVMKRPGWAAPRKLDIPVRLTSWLPEGCGVVVPMERENVGLLGHLSPKQIVAVVHNASRGIGIAIGK